LSAVETSPALSASTSVWPIWILLEPKNCPVVRYVSDGQTVFAADSPEEIYDLLQKGQGVFAIAVDRVRDDLAGSLGRTATERTSPLRQPKEPAAKSVRTRRTTSAQAGAGSA